jgi:hypothetical protein
MSHRQMIRTSAQSPPRTLHNYFLFIISSIFIVIYVPIKQNLFELIMSSIILLYIAEYQFLWKR